jgi:amidohydrolase
MPTKEELKQLVFQEIDSRADEIVNISKTILANPEPGFREVKTAKLVADTFAGMGLPVRTGLGLTGVRAELLGGTSGPTMALLGELDSLIVEEHPHADPATGAAHACGHHCQIGVILGAAMGLMRSDVLPSLSGRIAFMAVPAEEYIEIEYRDGLRRDGKIEFLGGKPELIKLGEFDDVHLAMMIHTTSTVEEGKLCLSGTNNGTVAKKIQFIGRGSHAGGAPHLGINALNAATLALTAIHFNRETFRDEDTIRVHPIITKGGEAVSAVPADVRMETFVRGRTIEAIMDANTKVDRALRAGAMAVGATVTIQTIPGYLPLTQNRRMAEIFEPNAAALVGAENVGRVAHRTGSTDMGDISQLMPALHPYVGGAVGLGHGANYVIEDYQLAVITAAKSMAGTIVDLLADGAEQANQVIAGHRPEMTRQEYLKFMRSLAREETFEA